MNKDELLQLIKNCLNGDYCTRCQFNHFRGLYCMDELLKEVLKQLDTNNTVKQVNKKAYLCTTVDKMFELVVFATTAGKAKSIAYNLLKNIDISRYISFTNIRVNRFPDADKYVNDNKSYLDWNDDNDRLILVKDLHIFCSLNFCNSCCCKDYCCVDF